MVYAYDLWAQFPTKDLYDSQIMMAAINAAKDMYEKGELAVKDFRKEYGDFMSPLQSDMDWYNQNFNVSNKIAEIYAKGGDPVRNSADRGELYRWINSRPYGEYNLKRQAANDIAEYKKNRDVLIKAGMYNPEYERQMLGGLLLEEWDGSLGNWTATSASPYLDYEKKYGHLFDKMGFEYDAEESKKHPGMQVMTKNKSRMHDILSSSIPDLRNDPQYQYDLNRTYGAIRDNNPDMSPADAMRYAQRQLENEIVERNYKGGMQMIEDPIAKEQRAFRNQVALENLRHSHNVALRNIPQAKSSGSGGGNLKEPLGMKSSIINTSNSVLAGTTNPTLQGRRIKPNLKNIFNSGYAVAGLDKSDKKGLFGLDRYNTTHRLGGKIVADFKPGDVSWGQFRNHIVSRLSYTVVPQDFPEYINSTPIKDKEQFGVVQLSQDKIKNLYNTDDLITHSYGYSGGRVGSTNTRSQIERGINEGVHYEMIPSDQAMPIMNASNGQIATYYKVRIKSDNKKWPSYTMWIKDDGTLTGENDVTGTSPVSRLDIDERYINTGRASANALDLKYKAQQNTTVESPISGAFTGYYDDVTSSGIDDDYFYNLE